MTESRFFDIDQILMEEEKLRVEMLLDAFNCESLEYQTLALASPDAAGNGQRRQEGRIAEHSEDEQDSASRQEQAHGDYMLTGTKFNTPLWLALGLSRMKFVKVQLPKWYSKDFINLALADPEVANLHSKNPYFYEVGAVLARKFDSGLVGNFIEEMFLARAKKIVLIILHANKKDYQSAFVHKLTVMEQRFYDKGIHALAEYKIWKGGKILQANHSKVLNSRKKVKLN